MKIYIDAECKCHTAKSDSNFREFELDFFDGKCSTFIEGYRYCPEGDSYISDNGERFYGECVVPWKPYPELDAAQRQYEREQIAEYEKALAEIEAALGVSV